MRQTISIKKTILKRCYANCIPSGITSNSMVTPQLPCDVKDASCGVLAVAIHRSLLDSGFHTDTICLNTEQLEFSYVIGY